MKSRIVFSLVTFGLASFLVAGALHTTAAENENLKTGSSTIVHPDLKVEIAELQGLLVNVSVKNVDVAIVLKAIAEKAQLKIIIADNVKRMIVRGEMTKVAPGSAIENIAEACNLAWGKVGTDTYLIVRQNNKATGTVSPKSDEYAPRQGPFDGRFWLLRPEKKKS